MTICACGGETEPASKPGAEPAPKSTQAPKPNTPTPTPAKPSEPSPPADPAVLAARGRTVFMSNCIACHNPDPTQDGALGPAVMGSSQELLEARVIQGTYPEGYTPKRDTKVMVPLNFLQKEIPALAAYLAQSQ